MKEGLTILITTYNREQRLINMLHSIERQGRWREYTIIVVDNCSPNYNWETMLSNFDSGFRNIINVHRRSFNCGMSANITSCFLLPETEWVLLLSDDDEMVDGSLDVVLEDCKNHGDNALIKYTIQSFKPYPDKEIRSLEEYVQIYNDHPCADSIFLTGLYNMRLLGGDMGLATTWAYTYIGFLIPVWNEMEQGKCSMFFSSATIIKYKMPEKGSEWKKIPVLLGFSSIFDFYMDIDKEIVKKLYSIPVNNLSMGLALRAISEYDCKRWYKVYLLEKLYYSLYKPIYGNKAYLFKLLSFLYKYLHINPKTLLNLRYSLWAKNN